jgi:hypothetical protein
MRFRADNFGVSIALLMAATIFMMVVRGRKPLESNWPLYYWLLMLIVSLTYETWDTRAILAGAVAGLLLRFEFLGSAFVKLFRFIEYCVWIYVLLGGLRLVVR